MVEGFTIHASSASTKTGQITKLNSKKLSYLLENPKKIDWKRIKAIISTYHPGKNNAPNLDSTFHQALKRACLDQSVCQSTLKIILQKTNNLTLQDRIRFAIMAVRCQNMVALQTIIYDDISVLFHHSNDDDDGYGFSYGDTLLHMVCEKHGWSAEIAFILSEVVNNKEHNNNNRNHEGLFQETHGLETPLKLSLQAGSDLTDIIDHVREKHPTYFELNVGRLSQTIAEYCYDMTLLSELIGLYGILLLDSFYPENGSSPLNFACYYQNEDMIRVLLEEYKKKNEEEGIDDLNSLLSVQKRLLSLNNEGMSPLGHLLLNVGDPDAENVWRCIDICLRFFSANESNSNAEEENRVPQLQQQQHQQQLHVLHLLLSHTWDQFIAKKNCMQILERIVHRLGIDVCAIDNETGKTILSILIEKLATHCGPNYTKKTYEMSMRILAYLMSSAAISSNPTVRWPAMARDGYGRLPLHSACEYSLPWKRGLGSIVKANMPALESTDPVTGLPPFAHYAVGAKSDINSIYELLRLYPSSIDTLM